MTRAPKEQWVGWSAVGFSTLISSIWAFWGIIENFHEGWFHASLLSNLGLMALQYLGPTLIFVTLTVLSIALPRIGATLHVLAGLGLAIFLFGFDEPVPMTLIILPMVTLGILYWFGRPQPRRRALWIAGAVPLVVAVACGMGPAIRVSGRLNDGNLGARLIEGNGVKLVWAPEGPGWPSEGVTWQEAVRRSQYLERDGKTLSEVPQNIWRLPTADEAVRSMARHGVNCSGVWDAKSGVASYKVRPDKESPLWNVHSQVIYWWTATEVDEERAYMIVYDGQVWPREKRFAPGYLAFRCVREP